MYDGLLVFEGGPDGVEVGNIGLKGRNAGHAAAIQSGQLVATFQLLADSAADEAAHSGSPEFFQSFVNSWRKSVWTACGKLAIRLQDRSPPITGEESLVGALHSSR